MKTVPTLCATATIVGASAAGLSFGRQDALSQPAGKRNATPARGLAHRSTSTSTSAAVPTPPTTAPARRPSSPIAPPTSHAPAATPPYPVDGHPPRSTTRRAPSAGTNAHPQPARRPSSLGHLDAFGDVEPTANLASRRSSWIQRLSLLSTSQSSSRASSPGPASASVSCSNGSMAFSHDGSTAPIVGRRPPTPLPPNKLVKRSSSVHVSGEFPSQGSGARLPSLRRPATSHQRMRSATLQHQSTLMEMTPEDRSADDLPLTPRAMAHDDPQYAQYFTAKVSREKTLRRGPTPHKSIRRIFPDDAHKPTLVLATSVSATAEGLDELSSEDGESLYLLSRPGTPMGVTAPPTPPSALNADGATRSRRSFSITEFLSPGSRAKKQQTVKTSGAKPAPNSSQRASSAPLLSLNGNGRQRSNTAHGEYTATSARRDSTDPALVRREVFTSAGFTQAGDFRSRLLGDFSSSPLPALPPTHVIAVAQHTPATMPPIDPKPGALANPNQIPPSPVLAQAAGRPFRHSVTPSEQASTLVGSDNDARGVGSGDEDDVDLQSDTMFDSLRTGATRSTSGARGPRIETIFDESPPSKVKITALRDLLPKGTFREQATDHAPGQQSIAEEEESISTPVRTIVPERSVNGSPTLSRGYIGPLFPNLVPSSPPDMPKPLSLGTLEWDSRAEADDISRWSVEEEEDGNSWADFPSLPPATYVAMPVSLARNSARPIANGSSPNISTPSVLPIDHPDRDARSSIFDWSEQQPTDKTAGNRSPPRPRTVHGKKDADRRGSRSVGRRVPSGLHARSQSVPVVPDAAGKRSTVVTNKFGTWGVGSKGVTEDWNDDFDFSEINEEPTESHRVDSGTVMVVPKKIQEQQTNVLANIGLLREWGLLIEELKDQRARAASLGLLEGPTSGLWEEVDAMVELADQEAAHDGIARLSPPSSSGFDEDAFDDVSGSSPNHSRRRRTSGGLASEELGKSNGHTNQQQPTRPRRKSILPPNHDIYAPQSSPIPPKPAYGTPKPASDLKSVMTRPRKDSEAMARSVIEALQKRKDAHEPVTELELLPPSKKVPFDTATLRRIVPYVNTLSRKVKEALREAEGLYPSPSTSPREPTFSKIFHSDNDLNTQMKVMTIT